MISMDKKYRTRSGYPVELLTATGRGPYPVVGYIAEKTSPTSWGVKGNLLGQDETQHDLIEVVEPVTRSLGWVNIYPETHSTPHVLHATAEGAARGRGPELHGVRRGVRRIHAGRGPLMHPYRKAKPRERSDAPLPTTRPRERSDAPLPTTRPRSIHCAGCGYEGPVYSNTCPECSRRVF